MRQSSSCLKQLGESLVISTLLLVVIAYFGLYRPYVTKNAGFSRKVAAFSPGTPETTVRTVMGKPNRIFEAATAPTDYYAHGYTYERRPITGRVLIYFGGADSIAYIWIDQSGKVEHTFVGQS